MVTYSQWRQQPLGAVPKFENADIRKVREICRQTLKQRGASWLTAEETRSVLQSIQAPFCQGGVARTAEEAVTLARAIGFPVAVKLASHQLVHKTEVGGVVLNLLDEKMVREAFESIRAKLESLKKLDAMEGVLVQPMLKDGIELMVGMTQDPVFGPLIAFGLGGIHVEILGDVCFRVTPLTDLDAVEMVRSIRGFRLLQGYRGHPPADLLAIEQLLLRISKLVHETPEIAELDLNPVMALAPGQGCKIVDARIRVEVPHKFSIE
jgi:acyl-CoA synthetase (NDP forming)